jgi:hypothetical protein
MVKKKESPRVPPEGAACPVEQVNHPPHYGGDVTHEVYKCLEAWGLHRNAYLWNAVKYIARCWKKGAMVEDLKKACWYLNREIARLEEGKL